MNRRGWVQLLMALLLCTPALAQGHGHGHGHGKHDDGDEGRGAYRYTEHDRDVAWRWYHDHENGLPPGLAKKDRLPPGLEKQLAVRGTLPPGLQKKIRPCPLELERQLPPPPPDYVHMVIGGHLVLANRNTHVVLDIIHFEP